MAAPIRSRRKRASIPSINTNALDEDDSFLEDSPLQIDVKKNTVQKTTQIHSKNVKISSSPSASQEDSFLINNPLQHSYSYNISKAFNTSNATTSSQTGSADFMKQSYKKGAVIKRALDEEIKEMEAQKKKKKKKTVTSDSESDEDYTQTPSPNKKKVTRTPSSQEKKLLAEEARARKEALRVTLSTELDEDLCSHLDDVFHGKTETPESKDYKKGGKHRYGLKYNLATGGFSEEEMEAIHDILIRRFDPENINPSVVPFVLDVLWKEAAILLIMRRQNKSREEAETAFVSSVQPDDESAIQKHDKRMEIHSNSQEIFNERFDRLKELATSSDPVVAPFKLVSPPISPDIKRSSERLRNKPPSSTPTITQPANKRKLLSNSADTRDNPSSGGKRQSNPRKGPPKS